MEARLFVRELLNAWGADEETLLDAELLITEVVTNAVIHARSPVQIQVQREDSVLHFSVLDEGGGHLLRRAPGPDDVSGRGLLILDRLASKWKVATQHDEGKTVHFWLDWASAPRQASG
jgi:anti-sigma regulatory factor (Ser/Thr protein kinase)